MRKIVAAVVLLLAATALVTWAQVAGPEIFQWISVEEDIKIGDSVFLSEATDGAGDHFRVTLDGGYMEHRNSAGGYVYSRTDGGAINTDFIFTDTLGNLGGMGYFSATDEIFISSADLAVNGANTLRLYQFATCPVNLDASGYAECLTLGSGISYTTGDLDIDLNETLDGAGSTSTLSGMEMTATDELALLQGCADTQALVWNDAAATWGCGDVDASGNVTHTGTVANAFIIPVYADTTGTLIRGDHVSVGTQPTITTGGLMELSALTVAGASSGSHQVLKLRHDQGSAITTAIELAEEVAGTPSGALLRNVHATDTFEIYTGAYGSPTAPTIQPQARVDSDEIQNHDVSWYVASGNTAANDCPACSSGEICSDTDGDGSTNCVGATTECFFFVCNAGSWKNVSEN